MAHDVVADVKISRCATNSCRSDNRGTCRPLCRPCLPGSTRSTSSGSGSFCTSSLFSRAALAATAASIICGCHRLLDSFSSRHSRISGGRMAVRFSDSHSILACSRSYGSCKRSCVLRLVHRPCSTERDACPQSQIAADVDVYPWCTHLPT